MSESKTNTDAATGAIKPILKDVRAGRSYFWCACGKSAKQPFCDGSHAGSGIEPLAWKSPDDSDRLFCLCKQTKTPPFCDGSHNALNEEYGEAVPDDMVAELVVRDGAAIAELNGGCFVLDAHAADDTFRLLASHASGAEFLSHYCVRFEPGDRRVYAFGASEVVLFITAGAGLITISGRRFPISPMQGIYVQASEAFSIQANEPVLAQVTVCPDGEAPEISDSMPSAFNTRVYERVYPVDEARRTAMADRFFQVLVGPDTGAREVTQFIGHIPKSRAAYHQHLYEEMIFVLSGEGMMWTGSRKASVNAGDVIFLPQRQPHSLECTNETGMDVIGVFTPAGSPAINY